MLWEKVNSPLPWAAATMPVVVQTTRSENCPTLLLALLISRMQMIRDDLSTVTSACLHVLTLGLAGIWSTFVPLELWLCCLEDGICSV